ncbi:hypothetical protein OIU77_026473 [Salix suchowensis]|uniref:Uncharacterized protein n=1 Tax=Salix suchowensis TaxID=1278906 RepID=A0ABQ9BP03_9ROSI|nr:hypothetical protein OIU77_026473 [Salix suchowensis]
MAPFTIPATNTGHFAAPIVSTSSSLFNLHLLLWAYFLPLSITLQPPRNHLHLHHSPANLLLSMGVAFSYFPRESAPSPLFNPSTGSPNNFSQCAPSSWLD